MGRVRFISKCTVQPANPHESIQRIELNQWDLRFLPVHYIQKGLLYLKPTFRPGKEEENEVINLLKTSLSRTLDFFVPLAGRLATTSHDDDTMSVFIDCNDAGAEFIHASADFTVADILDPPYTPRVVYSFFPLNGVVNFEGITKPLLAVQVTELTDGIFVACTVNHVVADGTSFWHFFNSWSEICRGADRISRPPVLQRWFPTGTNCPVRFSISNKEKFSVRYTPPPLEERVFQFTKEKIASLKAKANTECGTDRISSLQAILAHIWRSVARARGLDSDQEICYWLIIGKRSRLKPPLPDEHFGCFVEGGTATAKVGELLDRGLGWAAWLLNQVVASHNDPTAEKSLVESQTKQPKFVSMDSIVYNNLLLTGSSPRFNVYGNDLGWGRPLAVRSGCGNKFDGKITVFQGRSEGSVDVEACLSPQTLMVLGDDAEFMDAVTVFPTFAGIN
ncbi:PREDICTED: uncharacterized acetyltransferase At3g50280-like [Nelumbo nucifera]|uniref:Uncharacterized acetyltransferase At3g50280-like n=2 Tax=Nelumbo nucifera TaxID=4432 RepID=A0A1U8BCS2_NELNU|nr:PREDICTED: uncharacterized acetyltransferase At3g50280-like [Nelumbo nucifera]DAD21280.1 TPA_asm: hypothetical protein HUJ06_022743 [Nelumbo nucifera]